MVMNLKHAEVINIIHQYLKERNFHPDRNSMGMWESDNPVNIATFRLVVDFGYVEGD